MSFKKLILPSGGLYYHLKSFRYQKNWTPFVTQLNLWLSPLLENRKVLILGSSAGYCLTDELLIQTKTFDCFDQDPLAPFFWKRHHQTHPKTFFKGEMISWLFSAMNPSHGSPDLENYDLILFNNVLGQLGFESELPTEFFAQLKQRLGQLNVAWVSYHDLYSVKLPHGRPSIDLDDPELKDITTLKSWLSRHYPKQSLQIWDHGTDHQLSDNQSEKRSFIWPIAPKQLHLIEGVAHLQG